MKPSPQPQEASSSTNRRTTLANVASAAGVSMATVSKVINGRAGVAASTRARVEKVINESGYVTLGERQESARAAKEASVELLVDPRDVSNPYLATFLGGAMDAATALGVALVLRSIDAIQGISSSSWAQSLARAGRVGVVEVTNAYSAQREKALTRSGLHMVLVDPIDVPRDSTPSIGATNWAGAYSATEHLLGLGHRQIRYIGGPPGARCDIIRAHGWAAAMSEAGLEANVADVPRGAFTFAHGLRAATDLLQSDQPPTAIFAGSDASATGVLEAARRLSLKVPADLSVVGFDDTLLAQMAAPPLTTVHQPIADIGHTAVTTLMRLAQGESISPNRVELSTRLVIRSSTSAPR